MPRRFSERNFLGWLIGALAFTLVTLRVETHAQDLEPRAYANTPVGLNFLIAGYVYSKGGVGTDPAVPIDGVRFYTDNNNFLDGKTLQLSPVYSVQGHLIYSFTTGIWAGFDALYYTGARGTIDGRKGQSVENVRVGLTLALPINRYNSVKLYGSTNIYTKTRTDFDVVGIAWQFRWGGGL